jgi:hypothetical protein
MGSVVGPDIIYNVLDVETQERETKMDIPYAIRKELNELSKDLFGVSSRWQKMVKGTQELVTKKVKETVPGENGAPDTEREFEVPHLLDGAKQYRTKSMTFEQVKEFMLTLKKGRDEQMAKMKAAREAQELAKKIQEQAAGRVSV